MNCDRIPRRGHLHPLSWDHASGPSGALEEVLGFPDVVVRGGVVADRTAPDTAFTQLDVRKPRDASLRPASARSCREQCTWRGSRFSEKNTDAA